MKLLVCGGSGFIGSNFIRLVLSKEKDCSITNYDKLTYAGNKENLQDVEQDPRYEFIKGDIADAKDLSEIAKNKIDVIINFAAETHVDRSIHENSRDFVMTNFVGVHNILEATRKFDIKKYIQVSTDEVYGSLELDEKRKFKEDSHINPNSPYAATKAAADLLCHSYHKTHGVPVVITHCSNNYGPYQYPEKLIPFFISRAMENKSLPLYGDGKNVRDWIYVGDHCEALRQVIQKGKNGERYNIGANSEKTNIEIAHLILKYLNKSTTLIEFIKDRPAHDRRYAIDSSKIKEHFDWQPAHSFDDAIAKTIQWYIANKSWMENIKLRNATINAHIKK